MPAKASKFTVPVEGNEPTAITVGDGCGKAHAVKDNQADLCEECFTALGTEQIESASRAVAEAERAAEAERHATGPEAG